MDQLIGDWVQEAIVDGRVVNTSMTRIERSDDGFLVIRGWLEGPPPPDLPREWVENSPFPTTMVIGSDDDRHEQTALYADGRGVRRIYTMTFAGRTGRWWRDAPGFNQRFEGVLDGDTITGTIEMSEDGTTWRKDFDVRYRKR
jgi:hypothetical protein